MPPSTARPKVVKALRHKARAAARMHLWFDTHLAICIFHSPRLGVRQWVQVFAHGCVWIHVQRENKAARESSGNGGINLLQRQKVMEMEGGQTVQPKCTSGEQSCSFRHP